MNKENKVNKENKNTFKIPDRADNLIRLQRTQQIGDDLGAFYYKSNLADYNSIKSSLNQFESVLDVGCGVGGIDYFLAKHNPKAKLYLMDKTEVETDIYYGFKERGCFYNGLDVTQRFLVDNGVSNDMFFIDVGSEYHLPKNVDLIISLISWGFHYPLEVYFKQMDEILSEDGIMILDIRKGTPRNQEIIKKYGYEQTVLEEREKYERILLKKGKSL